MDGGDKVGHCQALIQEKPSPCMRWGFFLFGNNVPSSFQMISSPTRSGCVLTIQKYYSPEANLTFADSCDEIILEKIEAFNNFEFIKSEIAQGLIGGPDKAFIIEESDMPRFTEEEKAFIKVLHTSTERWVTKNPNQLIIYLTAKNFVNVSIEDFPNIKANMLPFQDALKNRRETKNGKKKWFQLWRGHRDKLARIIW